MEIVLVRHGIAVNRNEAVDDESRQLTNKGKKKTKQAALGLKAIGVQPDLICSSPLVRARQTARIIAETLCPGLSVCVTDALAPQSTPETVTRWLANKKLSSVLMVGHMPGIAETASFFCTGSTQTEILFKKAAACRLVFSAKAGRAQARFDWLIQPRQLRMLAAV